MLIRRVTLRSFGRLSGTFRFEPGCCNVVCERNEAGKSTLVDAILYSFYPPQRSRRGRRNDLHPLDKYAPWAGTGSYGVELELEEPGGRRLLLVNEFGNTPRTTLTDLKAGTPVPLDRQSFGERFFRMSQASFLQCFFLRQDEREALDRGELVQVIERAAVSDRRREDAPVRAALEALKTPRLRYDEFSSNPLQTATLLSRIEERLREEQSRLDNLEADRARCAQEIAAAEGLDAQIEALSETLVRADYECLAAEAAEAEATLERHARLAETQAAREARMAELEPYAAMDLSRRDEARRLHAEWLAQSDRAQEARRRLAEDMQPALEETAGKLAQFAPALRERASRAAVERLRALMTRLEAAREEVARQRQHCETLRTAMAAQGMPLEAYQQVTQKLDALPEPERQMLLTYHQRKSELEASAAEASRRAAEAEARAATARADRERLQGRAYMLLGASAASVVGAVLLILMNLLWAQVVAGLILLAGVAAAVVGLRQWKQAQRVEAEQRDPARQEQLAATAEASRLSERLAALRSEAEETLQRHGLDAAYLDHLRDLGPWARQAGEYQAAKQALEQAEATAAHTADEAWQLVRLAVPDAEPQGLDTAVIERAIGAFEQCVEVSEAAARLESEASRVREELEAAQSSAESRRAALEALIGPPSGRQSLSDAYAEYERRCEFAAEYHRLAGERPPGGLSTEEECANLERLAAAARARMAELVSQDASLASIRPSAPRAELQARLDDLKARLHDLRLRRVNAFKDADQAIERWRREGPNHTAEIARLETLRDTIAGFQQAAALAHEELAAISEQVFSRWAVEIERGVGGIISQITDRYSDVTVTEDLDVSVFSHEAGRRLSSRELAYLSTGARGQMALALRVAVSEYLSEHCGLLPLALDEPFGHWDDERFVAGMRFLSALASRHQVLVLSCHGWRFERLVQTHPDLAKSLHITRLENPGKSL
ncbi:MAG: AAA family ATPase [Candidatus Sumerlaeaceae bacterium]|nr:AAA family ATPase [Candidatus Sumerlaeaceae bacterium]